MFTMEAKKKYQRVLNTKVPFRVVEFIQPCNISRPKKKILNLAVKFYGDEILHEILADCSVWVPVCGLGHVNYVRARNDGRGAPYSVRSSTGGGSTALHRGESDPFVPCGAVSSQTRPLQLDRAAGATLVLLHPARHEQTFNRDSI